MFVLASNWDLGDGSEMQVIGVYSTRESAEKIMNKHIKDDIETLEWDMESDDYVLDEHPWGSSLYERYDYRFIDYHISEQKLDENI